MTKPTLFFVSAVIRVHSGEADTPSATTAQYYFNWRIRFNKYPQVVIQIPGSRLDPIASTNEPDD